MPRFAHYSGAGPLQQPGHVLAQGFHGSDAFLVALYIARLEADADIPIRRAGDDHLTDEKEVVQGIEGVDRARPAEFGGLRAPEVLLNGDHLQIRRWRREQQLRKTLANRPDLLEKAVLSEEDRRALEAIRQEGE